MGNNPSPNPTRAPTVNPTKNPTANPTYGGPYTLTTRIGTHGQAKEDCENRGLSLVDFYTQTEVDDLQAFVEAYASQMTHSYALDLVWVGFDDLDKDGIYTFTNGNAVPFPWYQSPWRSQYEPHANKNDAVCGCMLTDGLADCSCVSTDWYGICKTGVTLSPSMTNDPTANPSVIPTITPTTDPTAEPTLKPTNIPSMIPSMAPTVEPTDDPTLEPINVSTMMPTNEPSHILSSNTELMSTTSDSDSDESEVQKSSSTNNFINLCIIHFVLFLFLLNVF